MYDKCDCFSNTATTSRVTCVCAISETYCHRRPRVPASNDVGRIFRDLFTVLLVILDPKPGFQCVKTSDELRTGKTATRLIKPYLMEDHSNSSPKSAIFHYIPTINLSLYIYIPWKITVEVHLISSQYVLVKSPSYPHEKSQVIASWPSIGLEMMCPLRNLHL